MVNRKREIGKKGIFLYYSLAIVIPCIILGMLAFRGIQNDQALIEKEQQAVLLDAGKEIFSAMDQAFQKTEKSLMECRISESQIRGILFENMNIERLIAENELIQGVFMINSEQTVALHRSELLFLPDHHFQNDQSMNNTQPLDLKDGWRFEFIDRNYGNAYGYYLGMLETEKTRQYRGELLTAMARVRLKQGELKSAMHLYDSIQTGYSDLLIQKRIPLGLVALLEKCKIKLLQHDTVEALTYNLHTLEGLADGKWELEKSYFLDLMSKSEEILERCKGSNNRSIVEILSLSDSLIQEIIGHRRQTEYLLTFLAHGDEILQIVPGGFQLNPIRKRTIIEGAPYYYSIVSDLNRNGIGIIYDLQAIVDLLIHQLIEKEKVSRGFDWEIWDREDRRMAGSENISTTIAPVTVISPANVGPWDLKLYPKHEGILNTLFKSEGGLFVYMLIAVLVILAFGLIFTLRTVQGEIQLSTMKSTFVSTVSHEFKSPLTSIRHMAEMLFHNRVPSPERKNEYYEVIMQQTERLSHLVENILDFSNMEEGQKVYRFEPTDLVELVTGVKNVFQDHLSVEGFEIRIKKPPQKIEILGDRHALEQVFFNLLDNACKYSGESKIVEIILESGNESVRTIVKDYGTGIPKKDQERIFNRFYRVDDELNQRIKGAGIGLAIVKRIIDEHGGRITVVSSPGNGTEFILEFPF